MSTYLKVNKPGYIDLAYYLYRKTDSYANTKLILLKDYGVILSLGINSELK